MSKEKELENWARYNARIQEVVGDVVHKKLKEGPSKELTVAALRSWIRPYYEFAQERDRLQSPEMLKASEKFVMALDDLFKGNQASPPYDYKYIAQMCNRANRAVRDMLDFSIVVAFSDAEAYKRFNKLDWEAVIPKLRAYSRELLKLRIYV